MLDMNWQEEDPMYARLDYQPYQIENGEDIDLACESNCLGDADVYQPIPLTSEILYENLSELPEVIRWFWDDKKSTDDEMWFIIHTNSLDHITLDANIRYVHELQHIMRLCGIEKEIVIKN